jgi:hypothetical protein
MMELVEPKPLVTLRGAVVLFLGLLVGLVVLGSATRVAWGVRTSSECMAGAPSGLLSSEQRITLFPPGVECAYLNRRGEVVGRNRYP